MVNNIKIEVAIGNIDDALSAAKYPIDRIELFSAMELGGLTPSKQTVAYLKKHIKTNIASMVRPRGGNFVYSEVEFATMLADAKDLLDEGSDGIVFGFLNEDNSINVERTKQMIDLIHSYGKEAVFHKAFDKVDDQFASAQILIDLEIDRILTSGKANKDNILEGCKVLEKLNEQFADKVQILVGGGVRVENLCDILKTSKCKQFHATSKKNTDGNYLALDEPQLVAMLEELKKL